MQRVARVLRVALVLLLGVPLFERLAPYRAIRWYWKAVNPLFRVLAGRVPGLVLLETVGRRSGLRREVPVGGRKNDGAVWIVLAHARNNASLKNIQANTRVRVREGGRWRTGVATVLEADDPRRRALWVNPLNGLFQAMASSDQMTVRIDLVGAP